MTTTETPTARSRSFPRVNRDGLLAFGSGLVFAASTPPIDFQPGILLGLFAFALALMGPANRRGALLFRGFLFGLGANLEALRFIPEVLQRFTSLPAIAGWVALLLLSVGQAVPWLLAGAAFGVLTRRLKTPTWLAFGVAVYAATLVPAIFPWTPAGGLARWPVLLQTAEIVGERGVSFLVASGAALFACAAWKMRGAPPDSSRLRAASREIAIGGAIFVVLMTYGAVRMATMSALRESAPRAKIALLQPDFDAFLRWEGNRSRMMMDRLSELTKQAEGDGAVLTIWPESAYPYALAHGTQHQPLGPRAVLQQGVRGPVLTGAYLTKGNGLGANSAILVKASGEIGPSYDKRHLLWFGETVPLADTFPILRKIFARGTGLEGGTASVGFEVGPIKLAVLNCYEDTLPVAGREAMETRPNLLVNITNDAWFAGSAEGELHLRLAVLRAIETRRDLVRAVNRGPTTWVDATGRIRARHDAAPGLGPSPPLIVDAALIDAPPTFYSRVGEWPLALILVAAVFASTRRRRDA